MVHASLAGLSLAHPIELLAKAKATAQKAPELDSTLTDAHVTLGHVKVSEWDWDWAEREYQRALELSQSLVRVHAAYSEHLAIMGRHTEALRVVAEMRRLDPLNVGLMGIEGRIVCLARRYDESIERLRHALGLGDAHSHFWLARRVRREAITPTGRRAVPGADQPLR